MVSLMTELTTYMVGPRQIVLVNCGNVAPKKAKICSKGKKLLPESERLLILLLSLSLSRGGCGQSRRGIFKEGDGPVNLKSFPS